MKLGRTARSLFIGAALAVFAAKPIQAQDGTGVLARCGASKGQSYFFKDESLNPAGPDWEGDGISSGKIILVKLGTEWDIQFDDVVGAYSYRQDGAKVFLLSNKPGLFSVGAFGTLYTDIYTFDLTHKTVAWSSNKIGPLGPKVGVYVSDCE